MPEISRFAAINQTKPIDKAEAETVTVSTVAPTIDKPQGSRKVTKAKAAPAAGRAAGKSSLEGYERLTVYVRKETKDNLVRSLIGTHEDMSDIVQRLLDKHLHT